MEYFKNNVPAKALHISSSTVHNIIKRFRETGEILCVRDKVEDLCWMLVIFGPLDNTALLFGMILSLTLLKGPRNTSRNHWSTVNTICRAICRCQLKLYDAKKKPYVNLVQKRRHVMWAKANLKWTVSKWKSVSCQKSGQTSPNLKFCSKSRTPCPPG